ncbi:cAMP-specific 3',5'-cyclic phosphodiesterase 4C-like isoform X2 [Corticium candelabrum]|nr:cAMP-specific 3',5'-cyclic phosphodiesterase 4C-like isoform X2 [Corticium candelabrum]
MTDQNVDQQLPIRRRVSASGSAGGSPKSRRSRFTPSGVKVRVVPNIQLSRSSSSTSFEFKCMSDQASSQTGQLGNNNLRHLSSGDTIGRRRSTSRRGSLLYRTDADADEAYSATAVNSPQATDYDSEEEEYLFTPFAQILAHLHQVKDNVQILLQDHLKQNSSKDVEEPEVKSSIEQKPELGKQVKGPKWSLGSISLGHEDGTSEKFQSGFVSENLAEQTIEELDWCLKQLEQVHSHTTVGGMATEKIRRIMTRELSHFSSTSRTGNQVVDWVNQTYQLNDMLSAWHVKHETPASKPRSSSLFKNIVKPEGSPDDDLVIPRFGVQVEDEDSLSMILSGMGEWNFNSFRLAELTGDHPLTCMCYVVFKSRNLFQLCKISERTAINYFAVVEANYPNNSYHNKTHAADVVQAAHYLLQAPGLEGLFSSLEILSLLFASAVHDVGHPGLNNAFLVQTQNELATLYHDESVLENHHIAVAFRLLLDTDCNIFSNLSNEERQMVKKIAASVVLATDLAKHVQNLASLRTLVETKKVVEEGMLTMYNHAERVQVMECLVHCADLSNPARPRYLATQWTKRLMEEFYCQGDEERRLQMSVSPMMDRYNRSIEKSQVAFIDLICQPLWETWGELVYPSEKAVLDQLEENKRYWESQVRGTPTSSTSSTSEEADSRRISVGQPIDEVISEEVVFPMVKSGVQQDDDNDGDLILPLIDSRSEEK